MRDRSVKYSEESIKVRLDNLMKDYTHQLKELNEHHDEARNRWNRDSLMGKAHEAAFEEELTQLKSMLLTQVEDIKQEINLLLAKFKTARRNLLKEAKEYIEMIEASLRY